MPTKHKTAVRLEPEAFARVRNFAHINETTHKAVVSDLCRAHLPAVRTKRQTKKASNKVTSNA